MYFLNAWVAAKERPSPISDRLVLRMWDFIKLTARVGYILQEETEIIFLFVF